MSDDGEMLARQKAELEIEKLRAEIDQLKLPTSFIERNWQALVTAFAAILAACGGLAALVNAASQTVDLWTHLGQQKELVALQQSETAAQQATVEADKRDIAAQKSELAESQKVQQETQQLQAEQLQLDNLESFIHYQRANVFPNLINKLQQDRIALLHQVAALQDQLNAKLGSTLKGAARAAAQKDVNSLAEGFKSTSTQNTEKALVYIQYANSSSLSAIAGLQSELNKDGYVVPGIELISPTFLNPHENNEVRYFVGGDKTKAQALAKTANAYLSTACPGHPAIKAWLHNVGTTSATPALEIWTGFGCPAQNVSTTH